MNDLEVGSSVKCGICGRETKVQFVTDREGGKAFDLDCMHRNALCPNCGVTLVILRLLAMIKLLDD